MHELKLMNGAKTEEEAMEWSKINMDDKDLKRSLSSKLDGYGWISDCL